jgi:hypothetical protein
MISSIDIVEAGDSRNGSAIEPGELPPDDA